jgi:hypothetical protein
MTDNIRLLLHQRSQSAGAGDGDRHLTCLVVVGRRRSSGRRERFLRTNQQPQKSPARSRGFELTKPDQKISTWPERHSS